MACPNIPVGKTNCGDERSLDAEKRVLKHQNVRAGDRGNAPALFGKLGEAREACGALRNAAELTEPVCQQAGQHGGPTRSKKSPTKQAPQTNNQYI